MHTGGSCNKRKGMGMMGKWPVGIVAIFWLLMSPRVTRQATDIEAHVETLFHPASYFTPREKLINAIESTGSSSTFTMATGDSHPHESEAAKRLDEFGIQRWNALNASILILAQHTMSTDLCIVQLLAVASIWWPNCKFIVQRYGYDESIDNLQLKQSEGAIIDLDNIVVQKDSNSTRASTISTILARKVEAVIKQESPNMAVLVDSSHTTLWASHHLYFQQVPLVVLGSGRRGSPKVLAVNQRLIDQKCFLCIAYSLEDGINLWREGFSSARYIVTNNPLPASLSGLYSRSNCHNDKERPYCFRLLKEIIKLPSHGFTHHFWTFDGVWRIISLMNERIIRRTEESDSSVVNPDFRNIPDKADDYLEDPVELGTYAAIVQVYERPAWIVEEQVLRFLDSTVLPKEIYVMQNENYIDISSVLEKWPNIKHLHATNFNTKFFGRFLIPLALQEEYVALVDDDVIFGDRWMEVALRKIEQHHAAVSSWTAVVIQQNLYIPDVHYLQTREEIIGPAFDTETDIFGHWFIFKRNWIHYFFSLPTATLWTGEDLSFPYLGQELARMRSISVALDADDPRTCGELFLEEVENLQSLASGKVPMSQIVRTALIRYLVNRNWVLVNQRSHMDI